MSSSPAPDAQRASSGSGDSPKPASKTPRVRITRRYTFEAAHQLPNVPDGHKCKNLHGHSYRVMLTLEAESWPITPQGWVVDFSEVDVRAMPLISRLDHGCLNNIVDNPTAENLAVYILEELSGEMPELIEVTVQETDRSSATALR